MLMHNPPHPGEFIAEVYALNRPTVTNQVKFRRALASAAAPGFSITNAIDGNTEKGGWTASTAQSPPPCTGCSRNRLPT